eukprot:TRINITY_DN4780_c0_g2_i1.p1 TRINITY_DN4780_c0_g2~~TRINITY_DN4780_c0_g2_i1.p1  ORF type:complete len:230 (-),score=38.11 TRINITY_DN4780_c0_g2_i1:156-845(-)
MQYIVDTSNVYIEELALIANSPPPYESALLREPWTNDEWSTITKQIKNAVPAQYPLSTFAEFGSIEEVKPFRLMLMDTFYKGIQFDEAIDTVCQTIDDILQPVCVLENYEPSLSECTSKDANQMVSWQLKDKYEGSCKETDDTIPDDIILDCTYLPYMNTVTLSLIITSGALIVFAVVVSCHLIFSKKRKPSFFVIRKTKYSGVHPWNCIMLCISNISSRRTLCCIVLS